MARPKPPEERDEFKVSPPLSVGKKIREAAAAAGMGAGPWCVAVLKWAVERQIKVSLEPTVEDPTEPELPSFRLNEDPATYGSKKKGAIP